MKRGSTLFLQVVIVLIGVAALAVLLIEPHFEGRNVDSSVFQVYFNDPFLAYVYVGSIPFFVALFQMFKLLSYIAQNKIFSQVATNTLKTIKYCAIITAGVIVSAIVYLRIAALSNNEDATGAIMLGIIATIVSIVIATAAAVFGKTLQRAVDIKSENDLTV
ncbi:MAG: DUF2975 domain-containing protein [Candidatus Saccharimonadales bacterium]